MESVVQPVAKAYKQRPWILLGSVFSLSFLVTVSIRHAVIVGRQGALAVPLSLSAWQGFLIAGALVLVLLFITRFIQFSGFLSALFAIALYLGSWVYCWSLFPWDIALLIASILTILQARVRRVFVHNIFLLIGTAGIAIHFAFLFSDRLMLMIFAGLLFYDIVAGRPKGSVIQMASAMVHRGVIPGLIIPDRWKALHHPIRETIQDTHSAFIGSGDLLIPMVLVARSASYGWLQAVCVTLGVLVGFAYVGFRRSLKPFPALLPIGLGSGIAYFITVLAR
jgi:hypothetical protein